MSWAGRVDGLGEAFFASLEAAFEAELARSEDDAASDFAFSLRQDRDLLDVLTRSGPRLLLTPGGTALPLIEIGTNYALGRSGQTQVLVPAHLLVSSTAPGGPLPEKADRTMLQLLRRSARRGQLVQVETTVRAIKGRLEAAGKDHVWVRDGQMETAIALGAILSLSLFPWGSRDAS